MNPLIKKVLVCLDATEMDATLIQFAAFAAQAESVESIHFVNVITKTQLPTKLRKEFPDLMEKALVDRRRELEKKVIEHFDLTLDVKVKIAVEQGPLPSKQILDLANKHNMDVIVVGRKKNLRSNSVVTQRLARRASCSLMIVPQKEYTSVKKLMVATDFSKDSYGAMNAAIDAATREAVRGNQVEVICHHSYQVPVGYHYTGKSFEESAHVMEENARKRYKRFIHRIDTKLIKVTPSFALAKNDDLVTSIYEAAKEYQVDFVFIGGKGKTASTALFPIGTNTEKLISVDSEIPLLVVRSKHRNAGIIDMLQRI
jgi:nucleotide-binding universal stress UspA family protein